MLAIPRPLNNVKKGFVNRWFQHLNPDLSNDKWTQDSNKLLLDYHSKYGNKWKLIATKFVGRTDNAIKNQFFSIIRKGLRKASKVAGNTITSEAINSIKPKILSDFLNKVLILDIHNSRKEVCIREFIERFTFTKMNEIVGSFSKTDKIIVEKVIDDLQHMKLTHKQSLCKCQIEVGRF